MFTLYKTVHPPTGIDCSVYCSFLSPREHNLITASGNKLQVYRFNFDPNSKSNKLKLECFDTFCFYGTICAIKSCRYGSMQKDALVIAFSDAKVLFCSCVICLWFCKFLKNKQTKNKGVNSRVRHFSGWPSHVVNTLLRKRARSRNLDTEINLEMKSDFFCWFK